MTTLAPPRTAERHGCRVRLATGPAAPAEARRRVRDAIRSWRVPVDLDAALLLTSELVTNAIRHEAGQEAGQGAQAVMLAITSSRGRLRVDVHDTSRSLPAVARALPVLGAASGLSLSALAAAPRSSGSFAPRLGWAKATNESKSSGAATKAYRMRMAQATLSRAEARMKRARPARRERSPR